MSGVCHTIKWMPFGRFRYFSKGSVIPSIQLQMCSVTSLGSKIFKKDLKLTQILQQERLNMQLTQLNSQSASAFSKCYEIVCTESCLTCYRQRSQQFRQRRTQLGVV
ncbi:Hypothetical_protein [Hexamita inflata]|uniref:Hypothetical_protein n=1 Tax=Hexamita inflata TaxID=28002 RepID=A0AA86NKV6_9EUKA|nr:Hypothetical protein HINF_LOCUS9672 [Hexamita inflata]